LLNLILNQMRLQGLEQILRFGKPKTQIARIMRRQVSLESRDFDAFSCTIWLHRLDPDSPLRHHHPSLLPQIDRANE